MSGEASATPAPRVPCEVINCGKNYASKGNMMLHIKKHHKVTDQIQSPLGSFPSATSARVLFSDGNGPSVQGNSTGQVSSPNVLSAPAYICGNCDKHFETEEEMIKHKKEEDEDQELLNAVKEAEDLYIALQLLSQSEFEPSKEKEYKEEMKDKLTRFWDILQKKSVLQKQTSMKIIQLQHEIKLGSEVEENQRIEIEEKEHECKILSNEVQSLKNMVKEKEVEISELMEINEEVIEVP